MQISTTSPPASAASPATAASSTGKGSGIATPSTSGSSRETPAEAKWQVEFGFWDDLDVLYNEAFLPPKKPRIPSPQLDDASEWYVICMAR